MNVTSKYDRARILRLLVEGVSLRAAARITEISYPTVLSFLPLIGNACDRYHDSAFRNLFCRSIQIDEIWSFCHTKQKNLSPEKRNALEYGDIWTFVAIDPETKLVVSWMTGKRTLNVARAFISDLRLRVKNRMCLHSDGYKHYLRAVDESFGQDIDYGMLVKHYEESNDPDNLYLHGEPEPRTYPIIGSPGKISTSCVERQNVTMRQCIKRFSRRTNAHSKKIVNHAAAIALHFMYYNFARIHETLRVTPAMAAGLTDHIWSIEEVLELAYHEDNHRDLHRPNKDHFAAGNRL